MSNKLRIMQIVNEIRMDDLTKSNKETQASKLKKEIVNSRYDEEKERLNKWASTLGYKKPNKLSYEV